MRPAVTGVFEVLDGSIMPPLRHEQRLIPSLSQGGQWLKTFLLQAAGARPQTCDYCASAIPVGEVRCLGCGATAPANSPTTSQASQVTTPSRQWVLPLLLCVVFPPALFVIMPIIFWRWLRRENRGWLLPLLICLFFPPAVLLVAPALLWRPPAKRKAAQSAARRRLRHMPKM